MNLKQEKNEIRSFYRNVRSNISDGEKELLDRGIYNRLVSLWAFRDCKTLLCYVSKKIEVETSYIICTAWKKNKRVAVPRCVDGTREMEFYYINSFDDLSEGAYGLLEPDPDKCEKVTDFSEGMCIVPAMVFDREGYRLGFGKGYYDRFLSNYGGTTVGICYSDCICDSLPHGRYDKKVDMIITEKNMLRVCSE